MLKSILEAGEIVALKTDYMKAFEKIVILSLVLFVVKKLREPGHNTIKQLVALLILLEAAIIVIAICYGIGSYIYHAIEWYGYGKDPTFMLHDPTYRQQVGLDPVE